MLTIVLVVVFLGLAWAVGSTVLRLAAWFLVATMVVSLLAQIPVPPAVPFVAAGCWLGGHLLFRMKHGYWRSQLLQRLDDRRLAQLPPE
jgi:hypothetical protein